MIFAMKVENEKYLVKKRQPNQNRDLFVLDNKKAKIISLPLQ
jgi:hypothetical protein